MSNLTRRQRDVLTAIETFYLEKNYSPSVRDLCVAMNISSLNGVVGHLKALTRKGFISRADGKARSIHLVEQGPLRASFDGNSITVYGGRIRQKLTLEEARQLAGDLSAALTMAVS